MPINAVLDTVLTDDEPIVEPLSLTEFKSYAKIDFTDDDTMISVMIIPSARQTLEKYLGCSLIPREVQAQLENGCGGIELPYGPINGDVTLIDKDGNSFDVSNIDIRGNMFKSIYRPWTCWLQATYDAGYVSLATAATSGGWAIPEPIVNAIAAQAFFLYENRGERLSYAAAGVRDYTASYVCDAAKQLCQRYRRVFDIML
jgi:uncharacterized phiE125 gp8 family phage protein